MDEIEVFADIWCPFTHVGLRRLLDRRDELGSDRRVRVRAWPLELVNGAPMDADFIGEEIDDLRRQVAGDLFTGFRTDRFPSSTLGALALVESAYRVGAELGERTSVAVRDALFEHGEDIGDEAVIDRLASELSVPTPSDDDHASVQRSFAEGRERGVVGSPHFFTSEGGFFCPALQIARVEGHLQISAKVEAFEAFVVSCFGA